MAFEETVVICLTVVICVVVCTVGAYFALERRTFLQQQGIDRRAIAKEGGNTVSPYQRGEWWQPLLVEALKIPAIQNLITEKAGQILQKKE